MPPAGSLLYLMLHYALVMEAAARHPSAGSATRDVSADELVRSRKFLNIGRQPSPSLWEVFRAPANRIVPGEPTGSRLLGADARAAARRATRAQACKSSATRSQSCADCRQRGWSGRSSSTSTRSATGSTHGRRRSSRGGCTRSGGSTQPVAERRTGALSRRLRIPRARAGRRRRRRKIHEQTLPSALRKVRTICTKRPSNGGYVHAPSLNHATAAALLAQRLPHARERRAMPSALAVNLSSGRVRRAQLSDRGHPQRPIARGAARRAVRARPARLDDASGRTR